MLIKKCIKGVRANIYCEVANDKFLIYSFTHNTFAIIDVASDEVVIASCVLEGLEPNTVVEIAFSDPPTHLFYRDKEEKLFGIPVVIKMNQQMP